MTTVTGGAYGNVLLSAAENGDLLQAFGWSNTLLGKGFGVTMDAGQGQATVIVGIGDSTVNQTVVLDGYNNLVEGSNTMPPGPTAGADENITVSGGLGNSTVTLGNGADNVALAGYNNFVRLGDGADTISAGAGSGTVYAGGGNVSVSLGGWGNYISLGDGNDTVTGISGGSTVIAGNGNDQIQVAGWGDLVRLGGGSSTVSGINGSSTVIAGDGNNVIHAAGWGNVIQLGHGNNVVAAGDGNDSVTLGGGQNNVTLQGWGNLVSATGGSSTIQAGAGSDTILLSGSNLQVTGGAHATVVLGGATTDNVTDGQQGMVVQIGPGSPGGVLTFGGDAGWVVDLVGNVGGYGSVAAVEAALQPQGGGTTTLALGAGGATVTFMQPINLITPNHIKIG